MALFPDGTRLGIQAPKIQPKTLNPAKPLNDIHVEKLIGTAGTRKFSVDGVETADIAYNASAATIKAAIDALSNVADRDVTVTGAAGGPYTATFAGQYGGGVNVPLMTTTPSLTGGANTAVVAEVSNGVQTITLGAGNTGGSFTITFNGQTTAAIAYNATGAQVQAALALLSNIGDASVDVTVLQSGDGSSATPFINTFIWGGGFKNQMIDFRVNAASLTGTSTITVVAQSAERLTAREETQAALSSVGNRRTSPFNDLTIMNQRKPKDIGDPLRYNPDGSPIDDR